MFLQTLSGEDAITLRGVEIWCKKMGTLSLPAVIGLWGQKWARRDGSVVKSTCYSSRDVEIPAHTSGTSHLPVTPVSGDLIAFLLAKLTPADKKTKNLWLSCQVRAVVSWLLAASRQYHCTLLPKHRGANWHCHWLQPREHSCGSMTCLLID